MGEVANAVKGWHELALRLGISKRGLFCAYNQKKPSLFKHCKEARLELTSQK